MPFLLVIFGIANWSKLPSTYGNYRVLRIWRCYPGWHDADAFIKAGQADQTNSTPTNSELAMEPCTSGDRGSAGRGGARPDPRLRFRYRTDCSSRRFGRP